MPTSCGHLGKKQKRKLDGRLCLPPSFPREHCLPDELQVGDCWIALSLTASSGLILSGRVGKHTDKLAQELVVITEGARGVFGMEY